MEKQGIKAEGFLKITDVDTGELILEKKNAINFETLSLALARSLGGKVAANPVSGSISQMAFGNGAATVNGLGQITYATPNVVGIGATLYNQTFAKIVDNLNVTNSDATKNKIEIGHVTGNVYSDVIVTCTLGYNEPVGQEAFDNATSTTGTYTFNEIALINYDGLYLTHVVFSPIQKALNRAFQIVYTIRLTMV